MLIKSFFLAIGQSYLYDLSRMYTSSETQGQIMGTTESLNGRENTARRKQKNGEKSPWGQCLTRPVSNCRGRSVFWLVPENFCVFLPNQKAERRRPFGTGLVKHCSQGLFSPFFSFLRAIFSRPFRLSLAPTIYPWVSEDNLYTFLKRLKLLWGEIACQKGFVFLQITAKHQEFPFLPYF